MKNLRQLYTAVYEEGNLFGIDTPARRSARSTEKHPLSSFTKRGRRPHSVAIAGGALGDEGKGRVTDELTARFLETTGSVIHYRDNGGANAGHTVHVGNTKIALHQLGSGILQAGCTIILGKEMVLHPEDLVAELEMVRSAAGGTIPAEIMIDEQTYLSLDTHRAFESVLKQRESGGSGSTGRGISPAYADVLYRHPVKMRDLAAENWREIFEKHYQLYADFTRGVGGVLEQSTVPRLVGGPVVVGDLETFLQRLSATRAVLQPYIVDVHPFLSREWAKTTPFVFEKAQALGLDTRWGVYPDVTASNCGFDGIFSSTEGIIDHEDITIRAATIKATYTSSVGSRKLPTTMDAALAHRIREDANEYGATTKRPRDIVHIDIPMLRYLARVGRVEQLVLTHLDIAYPEVPIRVCIAYKHKGKTVEYRPDQVFLNTVQPEYLELPSWDGAALAGVTTFEALPKAAKQYIAFICAALNTTPLMATTGPKRSEAIWWV